MIEVYERALDALKDPNNQVPQKYSLSHCHHSGLYSITISGEPGRLLRAFMATYPINPFAIQLHTHKYGICLTHVKGNIGHLRAIEAPSGETLMYRREYISGVAHDEPPHIHQKVQVTLDITNTLIAPHSQVALDHDDIHTVYCDEGSIWLVEEMGYDKDTSFVYGGPVDTSAFYKKVPGFILNNKIHTLKRELYNLI